MVIATLSDGPVFSAAVGADSDVSSEELIACGLLRTNRTTKAVAST